MNRILLPLSLSLLFLIGCRNSESSGTIASMETGEDYPVYGGNKAGNRYSPLDQINRKNVHRLEVAWMYDATEASGDKSRSGQIQCQPIVVNGVLFGTTPELKLFALNAGTGDELWIFEPGNEDGRHHITASRGVAYWESGEDKRILYTVGAKLFSIDARSGIPDNNFGEKGIVDFREGLLSENYDLDEVIVNATSPGVVYENTLVIGSTVSESGHAAPGHIRAFDIITGELKWIFHTIPKPGEVGYDTWPKDAYKEVGGANSWSGMSLDEERGVVYLGTGSPSSDFYGAKRKGKNLFGNCVIALDAETGELKWYYQTIHHDLWDRDLPSPPNLTTINYNGQMVDVVVQVTKDGLIYVLNRDTGESLFPVEERPVPTEGLPGEHPYPTQKFPVKPDPLSHQVFTEDIITNLSPESHAYIKNIYNKYQTDHKFTPPSTEGTLAFGYSGGAEWGGNAIDPSGVLYQNSNNDPWVLQMIDTSSMKAEFASLTHGNALYLENCASCHGKDRRGSGSEFPTLENIAAKLSKEEINGILETGSGRMPSFQHISEQDREAIAGYLLNLKEPSSKGHRGASEISVELDNSGSADKKKFGFPAKYVIKFWKKLTDQEGYPGIKPPWGTLNAIDLGTGEYLWRVPLGEYPKLTERGIPVTGTENYGGPVATAGGLVFIAATKDERIRAFDKNTGKVLWEHQLPAGGFATPITYQVDGKQYVVIAAGGGRGQKPGGDYVAFSLKD
ncbi:PQQ-binding-like beta-propeller repeat protein [Zunongwangia sp. F260]|uniref:PQQ-binding-like beta-propeller repeat protein n=1 Tax=Autumnicola lenta TaxID=3075593 RepID=A0ABU3CG86_9FLAO|nr:PQQ-binding-like beta-propeller repeat protein [Zunongwangia sp. F260]MDT0645364.1 PQQ-binding-like beta-propeller repeat protein [Zunongwangia sp. F260]